MRLEDLQIVMYLPKIPEETKFFKGGLWEFEYIRGMLCFTILLPAHLYLMKNLSKKCSSFPNKVKHF
ncbi:UNVERIFIED_CONTAM: hypothetical protein NCL1_33340 [Trichonephila clavipes]